MDMKLDDRIWELLETWREPEIRDDFTQRVMAEVRDQGKPNPVIGLLPSRDSVRPLLAVAACFAVSLVGFAIWSLRDTSNASEKTAEGETLYQWEDLVGEQSSLEQLEFEELDMVLFGAGS